MNWFTRCFQGFWSKDWITSALKLFWRATLTFHQILYTYEQGILPSYGYLKLNYLDICLLAKLGIECENVSSTIFYSSFLWVSALSSTFLHWEDKILSFTLAATFFVPGSILCSKFVGIPPLNFNPLPIIYF